MKQANNEPVSQELNSNGVTHILNVTREIDNFFPSVFKVKIGFF